MAVNRQRLWRRLRLLFRWCRLAVLLFILALLVALVYLGRVGLPDFLKSRLQTELRGRGLDLGFERARLSWFRGVVADVVTVSRANQPDTPQLELGEIAIQLDWRALARGQLKVDGVQIQHGRLQLNLAETNQPPEPFTLDQIATQIRFPPGGRWDLEAFEAEGLGVTFRLTGWISHATELSRWTPGRPLTTTNALAWATWRAELRQLVELRRRMRFRHPPDVLVLFHGDARNPASFVADLRLQVSDAQTDWGSLDNLRLALRLNTPPPSNGWFNTTLQLDVDNAHTPWGDLDQGRLQVQLANPPTRRVPARVDLELSAREARTAHARLQSARLQTHSRPLDDAASRWETRLDLAADGVVYGHSRWRMNRLTGQGVHTLTNLLPESARATAQVALPTPEGAVGEVALELARTNPPPAFAAAWGPWTNLARFRLGWNLRITDPRQTGADTALCACGGEWLPPRLLVTNFQAAQFGGELNLAKAQLDVATRGLELTGLDARLDWRQLGARLGGGLTNWLNELAWSRPPTLTGDARLIVPPWTNSLSTWPALAWPTLVATGHVAADEPGWRGFTAQSLAADFTLSNRVWQLPSLVLQRPEGRLELAVEQEPDTSRAHVRLHSGIDPMALRPVLGGGAGKALGLFEFTAPPQIEAELQGCLADPATLGVQARVHLTNLVFRSEHFDSVDANVQFTNRCLVATNVLVTHADEWARAEAVGFNLNSFWVYLTNAEARMDPLRVGRVISTNVTRVIAPFTFLRPPRARVNGHVPARGKTDAADLTFELAGGPFRYWRFNLPDLSGTVHWQGNSATLTNLAGGFYEGRMGLAMRLDFAPGGAADFSFASHFTNVDLHALVADVVLPTNHLQGIVTGNLNVTHANTSDWKSWDGHGELAMKDGFLWDFPVFAIFSRLLNVLQPGSGNARATAAKATFRINRSVIRTEDLVVKAAPLGLRFKGTVDFAGNVDAHTEGQVLRRTLMIGPLINLVMTPLTTVLTYKVTGTLGNPHAEPLYLPSVIQKLFDPTSLFKENTPPPAPPAPPAQ